MMAATSMRSVQDGVGTDRRFRYSPGRRFFDFVFFFLLHTPIEWVFGAKKGLKDLCIYRYITINKTKIATWFSTRITAVSRVEILFFSPFRTGTSFFQSALCSYVIVYSIHEKINFYVI